MSIRMGVYDLFAFAIPGGFYLLSGFLLASTVIEIDLLNLFSNVSIGQLFLLLLVSYILGHVLVEVSIWSPIYKLVVKGDGHDEAFAEVSSLYNGVNLEFQADQWAMLQARISMKNFELAERADKHRATHMMLRSLHFAFLVLAFTVLIFTVTVGTWISLLVVILLVWFAYLAAVRSRRYRMWSYKVTFEQTIAYDCLDKPLTNGDLFKPTVPGASA